MRLYVVGDRSEFASAHVLADVRHSLLDAAGDVIATICHAPEGREEICLLICLSAVYPAYKENPNGKPCPTDSFGLVLIFWIQIECITENGN